MTTNKYKFDAVRYCQANMDRMGVMPTGQAVGALIIGEINALRAENDTLRNEARVYRAQCDMADEWRDKIEAELAALKEAARPVVDWYTRSKRHFPDEFHPRDVALEYDGPFGRVGVICLELDKLAALVGED